MLEGLEGWQLLCFAAALWIGVVIVRMLIERAVEGEQERLQGPQVAKVYLNGIEIGSLPVAKHKAMLAEARRNYQLYLEQAGNILRVVLNLISRVFLFVPALWLFALLMTLLAEPADVGSTVQQILSDMQQATPAEVGDTLRVILLVSMLFSLLAVMVDYLMAGARRYGYRDVFKDEVSYQLRRELEAPAHGVVEVLYWAEPRAMGALA